MASEENISKASSILKVLNRIDSKTNLYVIEKRAAYPRLYLLSNDDTLAALRNEEDVMTKIFGNGTLKVCNEKMMLSIWGQAIELEEDPLEKEIVKTLAQDASQIDQDDIALSSPTVEALSLGSNTSIANFSIPLLKKVELRMKSSYQRDLEKFNI